MTDRHTEIPADITITALAHSVAPYKINDNVKLFFVDYQYLSFSSCDLKAEQDTHYNIFVTDETQM